MPNPRRPLAVLATVALLALARESRADEGKRTSSLAWVRLEGAESCIAGAALGRSVEERLRRKAFVSASDADISVEGSIGPAPKAGFRAVLRVTARDGTVLGTRDVETRSTRCDASDEKLSLIVSVLIDPDAGAAEEAVPPPLATPPSVVERERVVVVHDAPPPPVERWRFALTVGATGLAGLQPGIGFGIGASAVLHPPHFWGVLVGGGIAASSSTGTVRGASAEASLADGVLALCPLEATKGRLEAAACAGALVGALRSRGIGFDTTANTSSLVAGPLVSGRLTLAIAGPLVTTLAAELVVPLAHAEVGYRTAQGEGALFRTSSVAGIGALGVGVQFP